MLHKSSHIRQSFPHYDICSSPIILSLTKHIVNWINQQGLQVLTRASPHPSQLHNFLTVLLIHCATVSSQPGNTAQKNLSPSVIVGAQCCHKISSCSPFIIASLFPSKTLFHSDSTSTGSASLFPFGSVVKSRFCLSYGPNFPNLWQLSPHTGNLLVWAIRKGIT